MQGCRGVAGPVCWRRAGTAQAALKQGGGNSCWARSCAVDEGQDASHGGRWKGQRPQLWALPAVALYSPQAQRSGAQALGIRWRQAPHQLAGLGDRAGKGGGQVAAQAGAAARAALTAASISSWPPAGMRANGSPVASFR